MSIFSIEMPKDDANKEAWAAFQEMINEINDANTNEIKKLAKELNISENCAADVWYLRSRSRHTPELEEELIHLHKKGSPPNIFEF